jgi:hypothetical protein
MKYTYRNFSYEIVFIRAASLLDRVARDQSGSLAGMLPVIRCM